MDRFKNFDLAIFLPAILLLIFSIVVVASSDPKLAQEQVVFALFGLILYFLVAFSQPEYLKAFSPLFYIISIALLVITFFLGNLTRGSVRWIPLGFGGLTLQASEISKFLLIVSLSSFFSSSHWAPGPRAFLKSLLLIGLPMALVFLQPDLGTTIVLACVCLLLLIATGRNLKFLCLFLTLLFILSPFAWQVIKPYQRERLSTFLNPNSDPLGAGYHIFQSKIAVGSGQIWGRGFGQGTQSHLKFLPEYHNDFIFATLSEEWGLLGASLLLSLYFFLLFKILSLYKRANTVFAQLLCLGTFAMIFSQFAINIGMNLGLAPVTGIPLPLLSTGGSSVVTTLLALGLTQSVALHRQMS